MNYLNLLTEMEKTHDVCLVGAEGTWTIELCLRYARKILHQVQAPTVEQAIRQAYLKLNPIPRNNLDGKLTQG